MYKVIENLVHRCNKCRQAAKHSARQEPVPWPQTEALWSRLHVDFADLIDGMGNLVTVDSRLEWPEVILLKSATSGNIFAVQRHRIRILRIFL